MNKNEEEILDSTGEQEPEAAQEPEQTPDQQPAEKDAKGKSCGAARQAVAYGSGI